jgi:hypothetical protein
MIPMLLRRVVSVVCLLLAMLGPSGCSLRKVGYDLAGRYAASRMVDTFALEGNDKATAERVIRELHKWHRREELPRYVQLIDGLSERLRDGLSEDDLRWLQGQGDEAIARVAARATPPAAEVLLRLREDQLQHAEQKMAKGERERFEKLDQSDDKYYAYRLENTKKTLKTWLGSYTSEQLAIFAAFHRQDRPEELRRREATRHNRAHLLTAIRSKLPAPELAALLYRWITTRQTTPSPDYQQTEQRQDAAYGQLLQQVDRTLSSQQRQHLLQELAAWRSDFVTLAAQ